MSTGPDRILEHIQESVNALLDGRPPAISCSSPGSNKIHSHRLVSWIPPCARWIAICGWYAAGHALGRHASRLPQL